MTWADAQAPQQPYAEEKYRRQQEHQEALRAQIQEKQRLKASAVLLGGNEHHQCFPAHQIFVQAEN